jgi:hypothetical protein
MFPSRLCCAWALGYIMHVLNKGSVVHCEGGTALHCTALHYTAMHCTALHYTAMHWIVKGKQKTGLAILKLPSVVG